MDYLDPKKAFRHTVILYIGYVCIAIGITIGTLVLVYQAYGFGIGKNGSVIQSGLVFFSSQPHPADLYIDGKLSKQQTNARLVLPEGIYKVKIARPDYQDWQRTVEIDGGSVQHFDYPLLFPKQLTPKKIGNTYASAPGLVTQSPDRRWLMIEEAGSISDFDVYDLKNPAKDPLKISLPETAIAKDSTGSWELGEWADDNQHVLLNFTQTTGVSAVVVDRTAADQTVNVSTTLNTTAPTVTLNDKKYDQYLVYDKTAATLKSASLKTPTLAPVLDHVLAYKTYSDNMILYATDTNTPAGKVLIKLKNNDQTSTIRTFDAGTNYLLDLTKYENKLYVVAGASAMNKVYIYRDPLGQLHDQPTQSVSPVQVMHIVAPNFLKFSSNAQFVMTENGQQFVVYDILSQKGYNYTAKSPIDTPQLHANWMDGNRLAYVSNGKLVVFDYDHTNQQTAVAANAQYIPAYAPDYRFIYTLSTAKAGEATTQLNQTSLLAPADQ